MAKLDAGSSRGVYATISINDFLRNKQNGGKAEFKRK
jgi:hypothetical protein